ncbi:tail fiber domain-containing protein [Allomesorhizobium alhagi]|uniref:Peptidase S74 domain-containing protein n=1 Tax=Mesorhizobium alhagi CCNWXJ12-2 TaxID=1107882 RepID=H0HR30_9HYPH|nr:tail fiber domain-containing protein [Mesorhizobium alhagi]EHK56810.1 hypothetical protein MAXJ12_13066 [Mesorhizobium alhagi CCNWXJ12-2]
MSLFTKLGTEINAPVTSAGVPRGANMFDEMVWKTEIESVVTAFTSNGGLIYATKAQLDADLAHGANSSAWVIGDSTVANNGIYRKSGVSGAGSWSRVGDLPYSFIRAFDAGAGTPNAIVATTPIPIPAADGGALITLNIFEANTASPVTVALNGGPARTIKTNSGNDVSVGGLTAGMVVAGYVSGSTFRLLSDQASAAIQAAAEAAAALSQAWAEGTLPGGPGTLSSKEWAQLAETTFETNAAAVIPSVQRFAVGAAVQSVDTGIAGLVGAAVRVFIDGVYQFSNTWGIAAGVITPVGGTWPGDGLVENMEVIIDATSAIAFNVPSDESVSRQKIEPELLEDLSGFSTDTPFGRAGLRVLLGLENDAHYGFNNGILDAGGGKWVFVYRRAPNHTVVNGSEIRAVDTYDKGATLENDRLIFTDASYDTRNFVSRVMANGRLGIIASRRAAGTLVYTNPIFIYSDDDGSTWSSAAVTSAPGGTPVNFHGNLIDYPTSVGGDDAEGFIAYTYGGVAGTVDAFRTTDNGATWSWSPSIATSPMTMTELSVSRLGTQDKWIMFARPSGAIGDPGQAWVSANPLSFGASGSAGVEAAGNPPMTIYDDETGKFWYSVVARRDRGWQRGVTVGIENVLLMCSADADALYAAGGDMSALGVDWSIVCYLPDWASGYFFPYKIDGKWYAGFVCGEDAVDHTYSKLCLIGDFTSTGVDKLNFAQMMAWSAVGTRAIYRQGLQAGFGATPPSEVGYLTVGVASTSTGIVSETTSAAAREHWRILNANGLVGSVTTAASATTFNTTSDGQLKVSRQDLTVELDIDAIVDALQPQAFDWLDQKGNPTGERGYGLIAQDVHTVVPSAVKVGRGKPGDQDYDPWGMDYSKLVIFLLAKMKLMDERLKNIEGGQ